MIRAIVYARYSSDLQSESSIEDQVRLCREHAARMGIGVVRVFSDAAISGSRLQNRPGLQSLLQCARQDPGSFDTVIAEALDRLSRDQEDMAGLFKRLTHLGIRIHTISEGDISELHVGLKGTMNALFLKDLAAKVRRGQRGRAEAKRAAGGLSYGYVMVREIGADGEIERGRRVINPETGSVILRIFEEYVAGRSPRAIARDLNRDGIPSPRGGAWNASTINGHPQRLHGILRNPLYAGRMIYGRQTYRKNPDSGARELRIVPQQDWVHIDVPEWRIVPEVLWQSAHAMLKRHAAHGPRKARRPRHLLSGLIRCGKCGGAYTMRSSDRLGCVAHREKGTCANNRTVIQVELERRVLGGIKERLLTPSAFEEFAREYRETYKRRRSELNQRGAVISRKLKAIENSIERIVDAIAEGTASQALKGKLVRLEAEMESLKSEERSLVTEQAPELHPNLPALYRSRVTDLEKALTRTPLEQASATEIIRSLISGIVVFPGESRGDVTIRVEGSIPAILELARQRERAPNRRERMRNRGVVLLVPRGGIEPPTP